MRSLPSALLLLATIVALIDPLVTAKKPTRSRAAAAPPSRRTSSSRSSGRANLSRRRDYEEDDFLEDDQDLGLEEDSEEEEEEMFDEDEEDIPSPRSRRSGSSRSSRSSSRGAKQPPSVAGRKRPPPSRRDRYEDDYEDEYDRPRRSNKRYESSRRSPQGKYGRGGRSSSGRSGSVVPYGARPGAASTFTRGLTALRSYVPDASAVREAAASSISAARETTSTLSANLYREVKGLTSSELEQVMLKATRPDDSPVKGKHVERLVGVTYQISSRYDIYDATLRKLWSKMAEKDWRTTIKALYILHRFSADGAPEHAPALKARLRELRRTRDPKRKDKFFNSKQLLAGDSKPESIKFRAFMSRYAHYVILRAQCFGGVFDEISEKPSSKKDKKAPKPITSTSLRTEHLEAAAMLLKAGVACQLKEGEECENTAIAAERVASDLIGLTTAVAIALNRALKEDDLKGADPILIKRWCEFYSEELQPQTRSMVKKTSAKLDAYGLYLPSRMGASVTPETLQKGLRAEEPAPSTDLEEEESASQTEDKADPGVADGKVEPEEQVDDDDDDDEVNEEAVVDEADEVEKEGDEYDEYEYEEEEYYDDEDVE